MVKVDLITGFLGSGKTTLLKAYAEYLLKQGNNIGILENDFGAVNVDMMLLQDLMGDSCELEMVAGGCDEDCHRRRFKTKLISMGMCGYDRVLIEPSGIYDTDEFFDVLQEEPLDRWYEIGSVIVVVDLRLTEELSEQAQYLLASQLSSAGLVIFSHGEEAGEKTTKKLLQRLNEIFARFDCKRILTEKECLIRDLHALSEEDFVRMKQTGYVREYYRKLWFEQNEAFQTVYFCDHAMTPEQVTAAAEKLFTDKSAGKIFRIKGFARSKAGKWKEMNATKDQITVNDIKEGQEVLIVIGEELNETRIRDLFLL